MIERGHRRGGLSETARATVAASAGVVLAGMLGCAEERGPRLDAVSPTAAHRDEVVTLSGVRLCGAAADCARAAGTIQLGLALPMVRVPVIDYSDTLVRVSVPSSSPIGDSQLIVVVNEQVSNPIDFEVLP